MASCGPQRCDYCGEAPCVNPDGDCPAFAAAMAAEESGFHWWMAGVELVEEFDDDEHYDPDDDESWMGDVP